jgi:hypothetical protein
LGVYAASDLDLPHLRDGQGRTLPPEACFSQVVDKHIATAFDYCRYGDLFPINWAKDLCGRGIAPHIALEPNDGLQWVQDNEYLRQFARDAAACGGPVFLRFASEMNGNWTAYHDDPASYKAKFRLVHDVMERLAPNVAMVWCVYEIPDYNIDSYYPGDAYVDWVGINIYSVLHHNNDPSIEAWWENPGSMLKHVYEKYGSRKPIAICEYAASHREVISHQLDCADFARGRLADMFAALPRRFPRVKLIDIFDCNNILYGRSGRKVNDYSVTNDPSILWEFRHLIQPDYFLSTVVRSPQSLLPTSCSEVTPGSTLSGTQVLSAWLKTYDIRPRVAYSIDNHPVASFDSPGDYSFRLDTSRYTRGPHRLVVDVSDTAGGHAGRQEIPVVFQ